MKISKNSYDSFNSLIARITGLCTLELRRTVFLKQT